MITDLSVLLQDLVTSYQSMLGTAEQLEKLAKNTKMLSFNSSIEAARAGEAGRGFAVIANEIKKFSDKSQDCNQKNLRILDDFHKKIFEVIGVRTADMAYDIIDKIDRNLFERNADVQAWSKMNAVIDLLLNPEAENKKKVTEMLHQLIQIYEVYYEIYLVDMNGKIVVSGNTQSKIGEDVNIKKWYQNTVKTKQIQVSDMYRSDGKECTITYSCPVFDHENNLIGVLSSRFNWDFTFEIIDKAKIGNKGKIYVINKEGTVIASKNREDILAKSVLDLEPVRQVMNGNPYGYTIEEKDNRTLICGYAHTRGYNAYPGKDWSVIVIEDFQQSNLS